MVSTGQGLQHNFAVRFEFCEGFARKNLCGREAALVTASATSLFVVGGVSTGGSMAGGESLVAAATSSCDRWPKILFDVVDRSAALRTGPAGRGLRRPGATHLT